MKGKKKKRKVKWICFFEEKRFCRRRTKNNLISTNNNNIFMLESPKRIDDERINKKTRSKSLKKKFQVFFLGSSKIISLIFNKKKIQPMMRLCSFNGLVCVCVCVRNQSFSASHQARKQPEIRKHTHTKRNKKPKKFFGC